MSQDDDVERVARAILRVRVQGFNLGWDDSGGRSVIEYGREMARAAIAALLPQVSPELIAKLGKLATYLTEQGEYEACDLIDTVVERLTPKAKG